MLTITSEAPSDVGFYTITSTATIPSNTNNMSTALSQNYSFQLTVSCIVTSLTITSQVADTTYTLNHGVLLTAPFTLVQDKICDYPFTYTTAIKKDAVTVNPSWITFDSETRKFTIMNITDHSVVGVYIVTSTAEIPSNTTGMSTALTTSYSFTLTVQSDCVNTVITDKTINNMSN